MLPFGGTFDMVTLSGSTLRKVFEFSVRRYGSGTGEFLQVSGTSSFSSTSSFCYSPTHFHHLLTVRLANRGAASTTPRKHTVNLVKDLHME